MLEITMLACDRMNKFGCDGAHVVFVYYGWCTVQGGKRLVERLEYVR